MIKRNGLIIVVVIVFASLMVNAGMTLLGESTLTRAKNREKEIEQCIKTTSESDSVCRIMRQTLDPISWANYIKEKK